MTDEWRILESEDYLRKPTYSLLRFRLTGRGEFCLGMSPVGVVAASPTELRDRITEMLSACSKPYLRRKEGNMAGYYEEVAVVAKRRKAAR